jgi:hypothetical protein
MLRSLVTGKQHHSSAVIANAIASRQKEWIPFEWVLLPAVDITKNASFLARQAKSVDESGSTTADQQTLPEAETALRTKPTTLWSKPSLFAT